MTKCHYIYADSTLPENQFQRVSAAQEKYRYLFFLFREQREYENLMYAII